MPSQQRVGGGLPLVEAAEGFHLAGEAGAGGGQHRALAGQVADLPVHHVAEQHRHLVVQVVAGGQGGVAPIVGHAVHDVALDQPADRARLVPAAQGPGSDLRDGLPVDLFHVHHDQAGAGPALRHEAAAFLIGLIGVADATVDAQADVKAVGR
jgi:hypothetical protein